MPVLLMHPGHPQLPDPGLAELRLELEEAQRAQKRLRSESDRLRTERDQARGTIKTLSEKVALLESVLAATARPAAAPPSLSAGWTTMMGQPLVAMQTAAAPSQMMMQGMAPAVASAMAPAAAQGAAPAAPTQTGALAEALRVLSDHIVSGGAGGAGLSPSQ